MNKEKKRRIAYEVMTFLGTLALVLYITRLWPILLLVIVGIFICALRLLFFSVKSIAVTPPEMPVPLLLPAPEAEQGIIQKAFDLLQRRITEEVLCAYPKARWVWSNPRPLESFVSGDPLIILLSGAGGYRRAQVCVSNLQFVRLAYDEPETSQSDSSPVEEAPPESEDDPETEGQSVNYGRIAFEWVEAHLMELSGRVNEAIANQENTLLISSHELPHPDSWMDVCTELRHNGFESAGITGDGISLKI